jgi:hypothetical protein
MQISLFEARKSMEEGDKIHHKKVRITVSLTKFDVLEKIKPILKICVACKETEKNFFFFS